MFPQESLNKNKISFPIKVMMLVERIKENDTMEIIVIDEVLVVHVHNFHTFD